MNTQERIQEFFETNPNATECFEALGKVFTEKEKAQKFLGGVAGRFVTTHSREGQNFERVSDKLRHEIVEQENLVNDKQGIYEDAPAMEKQQALAEWHAAKDKLYQMQSAYDKQIIMEEKEELLAKEDKELTVPAKKELSIDDLKGKINAQETIVKTNEELIAKMPEGQKKKKAVKKQKEEKKLLESLKDQLKAAEEKAAEVIDAVDDNTPKDNAGEDAGVAAEPPNE